MGAVIKLHSKFVILVKISSKNNGFIQRLGVN